MLVAAFATLLLALPTWAQDTNTTAPVPTDGATTTNETDSGGAPGWNKTAFAFPNRGEQGFWVANATQSMYWTPVIEPTYIRISNSNTTLWADSFQLSDQINGGIGNLRYLVPDMPTGNNYILTMHEVGTDKKLAQSQGFRIKPAGSTLALYTPTSTDPTTPQPGANTTTSAPVTGTTGNDSDSASAAPSPSSPGAGDRVSASVVGALLALGAVLAVV